MDIYKILHQLGIKYIKHDHPAVFTVEESKKYSQNFKGGKTKNLFLRNKKGDQHYLVVLEHEKKADLKKLKEILGESKLSFASPERLMKYLGVTPGSVSLANLLNNDDKSVIVVIDADLWKQDVICCHPNSNDATLEIKREDLQKFLDWCGNEVRLVEL